MTPNEKELKVTKTDGAFPVLKMKTCTPHVMFKYTKATQGDITEIN